MALSRKAPRKGRNYYGGTIDQLVARVEALSGYYEELAHQQAGLLLAEQVLKEIVDQQQTLQLVIGGLNNCSTASDDQLSRGSTKPHQQQLDDFKLPSIFDSKPANYAAYLLYHAQPADVQQAIEWTADEWCTFYTEAVAKLCTLMEVIARDYEALLSSMSQLQQPPPHPPGQHLQSQQTSFMTARNSSGSGQTEAPVAAAINAPLHSFRAPSSEGGSPYSSSSDRSSVSVDVQVAEQTCAFIVDQYVRMGLLQQAVRHGLSPGDPPYFTAYRAAAMINLATGVKQTETGFKEHWVQVACALNLTPQQLQKMQICYKQYNRCKAALRQRQLAVCQQVECDLGQKMQKLGLNGDTPSHAAAEAAAAASTAAAAQSCSAQVAAEAQADPAAAVVDSVSNLGGILSGVMVTNQMLAVFFANTLSYLQLARLMVSSYPYLPQPGSIFEALDSINWQPQKQAQGEQPAQGCPQDTSAAEVGLTPTLAGMQTLPMAQDQQHMQQQAHQLLVRAPELTVPLIYVQHETQLTQRQQQLQQQRESFWQQRPELLAAFGAAGGAGVSAGPGERAAAISALLGLTPAASNGTTAGNRTKQH